MNNSEELSISTTSKLHSTYLPLLEVFYQSQKIPFQRKTEIMSFINYTVRTVKLFMLEKQKELSTSEPMSTSQLSNQLAKEVTLQNTVGNTTMTLIGITREYWILKRIGKPG